MQRFIEYIIGLILLILLQVLVCNRIDIYGVVNPYLFIMFLVMLPMEFRGAKSLMVGFLLGILMDAISGTAGLFTITSTWLAFIRPGVLNLMVGRNLTEIGGVPTSSRLGWAKFLGYTAAMVLLFNIPLFSLEMMTYQGLLWTLLRIVASSIATIILISVCNLPLNSK